MVNRFNYQAARDQWTPEMETIVMNWKHFVDSDVDFSDYLDAFVWCSGAAVFSDSDLRHLARDRMYKFIGSKRKYNLYTPQLSSELYLRLKPTPLVTQLYNISGPTNTPTNEEIKSMARSKKTSNKDDESVDASFTNPGVDDLNMTDLVISKPRHHRIGMESHTLKLFTSDNVNRILATLSNGRFSTDGRYSHKSLIVSIPLESYEDHKYYSLKLSMDDINEHGFTALVLTYPITSVSRFRQLGGYLEDINGQIEDYNTNNAAITTAIKTTDNLNRKMAFTQVLSRDLHDQGETPMLKTIKLKLSTFNGQQLVLASGQDWQGEIYSEKVDDELMLTPRVVNCYDLVEIEGEQEATLKTTIHWEASVVGQSFSSLEKSPVKKTSRASGAAARRQKARDDRNAKLNVGMSP